MNSEFFTGTWVAWVLLVSYVWLILCLAWNTLRALCRPTPLTDPSPETVKLWENVFAFSAIFTFIYFYKFVELISLHEYWATYQPTYYEGFSVLAAIGMFLITLVLFLKNL